MARPGDHLHRGPARRSGGHPLTTPFDPRRNVILVPVVITGPRRSVRGLFALDTGATWTVATPSILVSAGYAVAEPTRIVSVVTASGTERAGRVAVEAIAALGVRSGRTEVIAHDLPPALGAHRLLGLDFLRDRKLAIDFAAGTIDLD